MRRVLGFLAVLLLLGGVAFVAIRLTGGLPEPALPSSVATVTAIVPPSSLSPRPSSTARSRAPGPEATPGEAFTVELMDPPATRYASPDRTAADTGYAALVAKLGRSNITYDPSLGRAARELALQQSYLNGLVPSDIVDFVLRSSGAVDRAVEQGYVMMTDDGDAALSRQIQKLLEKSEGTEPVRVGIGEVWLIGSPPRRVAGVLLSRRGIEVDPAPRRVEPGETWTLTGTLPRGFTSPSVTILRDDGTLEDGALKIDGDRFRADIKVGPTAGKWEMSIGAVGPFGHTPLVQLPIDVGQDPPQTYTTHLPPNESGITSIASAEELGLQLLNADRARAGLPALAPDPSLAAIARSHSEDMRDHHFFGHTSPTTGGPGERLTAGHYRYTAYAENVSLHGSMHESEAALYASLGHRKNILHKRMTRVGIGVAWKENGPRKQYYVTQLFSDPVREIDASAVASTLVDRVNARRKELGLSPFAIDTRLGRIARANAEAASRGELDGISKRVLDSASSEGLSAGGSRAWAARGSDPAEMMPAPELVEGAYARAGVGVAQRQEDGALGVVIIVAAP